MVVRLRGEPDYRLVTEALDPEERGELLLAAARDKVRAAMTIIGDCDRCGEAVTESEGFTVCDGENLCDSCAMIAAAAHGETPPLERP
jgi:hypothetical protein